MAKKAKKTRASQQSGFTLIELLAVITIMGILMMVAIPAVSRTIENSRRDTFADTATAYINAVKNSVSADEILCSTASDTNMTTNISSAVAGTYYLNVATEDNATYKANSALDNSKALMESGGKSSWGNANVRGYVVLTKDTTNNQTKYTYQIVLTDSGNHGTNGTSTGLVGTNNIVKRSDVSSSATLTYTSTSLIKAPSNTTFVCKVDA